MKGNGYTNTEASAFRRETIDGRPVHAGDIAVLSRTNVQAQAVQAALRELGIPGVVYGDASVFDQPEAEQLDRVLTAVAEPTLTLFINAASIGSLLSIDSYHLVVKLLSGNEM